jgi:hypothetical protein
MDSYQTLLDLRKNRSSSAHFPFGNVRRRFQAFDFTQKLANPRVRQAALLCARLRGKGERIQVTGGDMPSVPRSGVKTAVDCTVRAKRTPATDQP